MSDKESIATKIIEAGGSLSVKSALNPMLWLCVMIDVPCFILIGILNPPPAWLIVLTLAPVCVALFGFLFLLFVDCDKLQSEEYQLKKRSMEMFQQKGDSEPTLITSESMLELEAPDELSENKLITDKNNSAR